jgi:hypothetical protein
VLLVAPGVVAARSSKLNGAVKVHVLVVGGHACCCDGDQSQHRSRLMHAFRAGVKGQLSSHVGAVACHNSGFASSTCGGDLGVGVVAAGGALQVHPTLAARGGA